MGDLGDGTIYKEIDEVLEQLRSCVNELQNKMADLAAVRGLETDDDD